ncbi:MAG TPA: flagellar biosynthesis protein FlhB [Firmicutes bacterium]|nr:flagellar biosynthesis protein FlhB [Bacillota bacterium]
MAAELGRKVFLFDLQRFAGERTEPATPKRKEDARKKGQVPRSHELVTAGVLTALFFLLHQSGAGVVSRLADYLAGALGTAGAGEVTEGEVIAWYTQAGAFLLAVVAPVFLVSVGTGLVLNFLQVGFLFTTAPLQPELGKINPGRGLQRLFGRHALVELVKSVAKVILIAWAAYGAVRPAYEGMLALNEAGVEEVFPALEGMIYRVGVRVCGALFVLAVLDYAYQRWDYGRNLRMSKQEVKDELKQQEGDPHVRGQIKARMRQMAMRRMMQRVPQADVVITNPTHLAVALQYDARTMSAPEVVAMGADYLAQRIRELAREHGVPIVENPPLARALWSTSEVGQAVPVDLYQAVAEVLAFVYRLKRRRA